MCVGGRRGDGGQMAAALPASRSQNEMARSAGAPVAVEAEVQHAVAMRVMPALLILGSCTVPSMDSPNAFMDEAFVTDANVLEPSPCSERDPFATVSGPSILPKSNVYSGEDTGAWSMTGGGYDGFFFFTMSDTNSFVNGSILVYMQANDGRSLYIMVRAFGSDQSFFEEFEGPGWEAASTETRAARVKASIVRYAKLVEGQCGAKLSSLDDELATFNMAFRVFDRRKP